MTYPLYDYVANGAAQRPLEIIFTKRQLRGLEGHHRQPAYRAWRFVGRRQARGDANGAPDLRTGRNASLAGRLL